MKLVEQLKEERELLRSTTSVSFTFYVLMKPVNYESLGICSCWSTFEYFFYCPKFNLDQAFFFFKGRVCWVGWSQG